MHVHDTCLILVEASPRVLSWAIQVIACRRCCFVRRSSLVDMLWSCGDRSLPCKTVFKVWLFLWKHRCGAFLWAGWASHGELVWWRSSDLTMSTRAHSDLRWWSPTSWVWNWCCVSIGPQHDGHVRWLLLFSALPGCFENLQDSGRRLNIQQL